MWHRLRNLNPSKYLVRENILLLIAAGLGFWMAWNTVFVVLKNNQLLNEIRTLEEEVAVLELENQNLELGIQYYKTDDFLEQSAREDLLLQRPDENVAIAPKTLDAKFQPSPTTTDQESAEKSNVQHWMDFLLGRNAIK